ncbi:MAG: hypothetical protein HQL75_09270 [Magnetococcales bacterium]|nr:hypothetical protein [Magnetococcales bacterium]
MEMIKPGKRDVKHLIRITGPELTSLQALTVDMSECFGLDSRIGKYQGKRPIGLYQWDLDCLIGAIEMGIKDIQTKGQAGYGRYGTSDKDSLNRLLQRLQSAYTSHDKPTPKT